MEEGEPLVSVAPAEIDRHPTKRVHRDVDGIISAIMCLIGFAAVRFVERSETGEEEG